MKTFHVHLKIICLEIFRDDVSDVEIDYGEEKKGEDGDFIDVGGVRWNKTGDVLVDASIDHNPSPRIKWPRTLDQPIHEEVKIPLEYFKKSFPFNFIGEIMLHTNRLLTGNLKLGPMSRMEFMSWMGIRLGMSLERERGDIDAFFSTESRYFIRPGNYEKRTGMSAHRFKAILRCLHFDTPTAPTSDEVSILI
jgi:hypothetical protein